MSKVRSERKPKAKPQARRRRVDRSGLLDDDVGKVRAGDSISFSYGIPPIHVIAPLIKRSGRLIVLTQGHDPEEIALRNLRRHVGCWYKQNTGIHRTGGEQ